MDLDQIEKLAELREKGLISEEEYATAKARILRSGEAQSPARVAGDMDNRTYSMLLHFSQFCNFIIPFFGLIVPVALWLTRRDDPYVDQQGRVVMNWILSSLIYFVICLVLMLVVIGVFLLIGLGILSIVFTVMGAVRAKDGVIREYPLSIPFFSVTPNLADGSD
ncbi:DUF4870 domain-containing protein [Marinimicrobium sp. C2-29]|uniref:DUF4870 domain-containing protein n=1 Tax=Marinimicrobium sp. C2-29 TaxID=3139825 RepID=UPI0031386CA6